MATLDIRLDRHVGMQSTQFGVMEVDLHQYFVMARTAGTDEPWVHLVYICEPCATNPRPPFNGLESFRTLPQTLKDEVVQLVSEQLGLVKLRSTEIPAPVVIEEDAEEWVDDEA